MTTALALLAVLLGAEPLSPGEHARQIEVDGRQRVYLVHVPPQYDREKPTPLVLALHGAAMNGPMMQTFSGLSEKADRAGFIVVYPDGTGPGGLLLTWNSGGLAWAGAERRPDDVKFLGKVLDDLATVVHVDPARVYATGMSNGAMMCYRLAAEMPDRIAAIAPVAGTLAAELEPKQPMPVIHFHGTKDSLVPYHGRDPKSPKFVSFLSVEDTIKAWAKIDGCPAEPAITELPNTADDGTTVKRQAYSPGKDGAEVVLYRIDGGGHTWPGGGIEVAFLGNTTRDISANDLLWAFFQKFHR